MFLSRFLFIYTIFFCARARCDAKYLETVKLPFKYLEEKKYPYENHTVITQDGYRLLLVRIPNDRNESPSKTTNPPILFVHGFLGSLSDFLFTGPGISIGFKAVEEGYDAFFLNVRGNRFSRSHTTLNPDSNAKQFWNFSWHEIGIYDLPAAIDYIINITEFRDVSYVGYSQGTTSFLVMTSTRPEYNNKIRLATLLAPVAYFGNAKFILAAVLKHVVGLVQAVVDALHIREIFPYNPIRSRTEQLICSPHSVLLPACNKILYESVGPSSQINNSILSTYVANFPSGASIKQFLHYLQLGHSNQFRLYDYAEKGNLIQYGQSTPPNYNLSAVSCPVALYYGANDYLADVQDVKRLANDLPNVVENVLVPYNKTNHLDVLLGKRALALFTRPALNLLNRYNNF